MNISTCKALLVFLISCLSSVAFADATHTVPLDEILDRVDVVACVDVMETVDESGDDVLLRVRPTRVWSGGEIDEFLLLARNDSDYLENLDKYFVIAVTRPVEQYGFQESNVGAGTLLVAPFNIQGVFPFVAGVEGGADWLLASRENVLVAISEFRDPSKVLGFEVIRNRIFGAVDWGLLSEVLGGDGGCSGD